MNVQTISPREVAQRREAGRVVELIDVRTPVEYAAVHVPGARSMPLDTLDPLAIARQREGEQEPLYVICRSGGRAAQACQRLLAAGGQNILSVEGGTSGWEQAGLPVVRGRRSVSLERQVRITAGLLVVLGVVFGWWIHPGFSALAAIMGAGLAWAGITDSCAMGMMLAKMPWNRVTVCGDGCCQ